MKKCVDSFAEKKKKKKIPRCLVFYVHFGLSLKIVRREHLKIFLDVSLVFFFFRGGMMHVRKTVFVIRRLFV